VPVAAVGTSSNDACATYPTVAMIRDVRVPITNVGTTSNRTCPTRPIVGAVHDVSVPIADVGASSNRACATCPIVAMDEVRPLLLGDHTSDGTAVVGHLPVATKGYIPLLQRWG
jgi:hypothetical protein